MEVQFVVPLDFADILTAELGVIGYEAFTDSDQGITAYIPAPLFDEKLVQAIQQKYRSQTAIDYTFTEIAPKNWNEAWEQSYSSIVVGNTCRVRATFHPASGQFPYELVIQPKMSFGTGHHVTTALMIESQLATLHQQKRVLDVGCGTGILAILAEKLGAGEVDAIDIDAWAVENARENSALNQCERVRVHLGTITNVPLNNAYDILLANINRNILVREMPIYAGKLVPGGNLIVSGFYANDIPDVVAAAQKNFLRKKAQKIENNWASIVFSKVDG